MIHYERKNGRIYMGQGDARKVFPDPLAPELRETIYRTRYHPEELETADYQWVLAAADAYIHLTTYPLGVEHTVRDLRAIRRVLRAEGYKAPKGDYQ